MWKNTGICLWLAFSYSRASNNSNNWGGVTLPWKSSRGKGTMYHDPDRTEGSMLFPISFFKLMGRSINLSCSITNRVWKQQSCVEWRIPIHRSSFNMLILTSSFNMLCLSWQVLKDIYTWNEWHILVLFNFV